MTALALLHFRRADCEWLVLIETEKSIYELQAIRDEINSELTPDIDLETLEHKIKQRLPDAEFLDFRYVS